jgi:BphX-like
MIVLQWWMRLVGLFYVALCAGALARQPIRAEGPAGVLEKAAAGDPTARFVIDTWVTLGLLLGVIGAVLMFCSREPNDAIALVKTVIAIELAWGIPVDVYKMSRGYKKPMLVAWIVTHSVISLTGLFALGRARG